MKPDLKTTAPEARKIRILHFLNRNAVLSILLCAFLLSGAVLLFMSMKSFPPGDVLSFRIQSDNSGETLLPWFDGKDCFVFLPSYAEKRKVLPEIAEGYRVTVGDIRLNDTSDLSALTENTEYRMTVSYGLFRKKYHFMLLHNSKTPAMFIDTKSGSMQSIHMDKSHKERVRVCLIDADGATCYSGEKDKLSGRGNGSWSQEKKPYTLTLSEEYPILGMNSAKKWVLLANASDSTNLRNKLILQLAD